jgi:hypothetical protein
MGLADIGDHLEKFLSAWKALLPVIAVAAGGIFWFAKTFVFYSFPIGEIPGSGELTRALFAFSGHINSPIL